MSFPILLMLLLRSLAASLSPVLILGHLHTHPLITDRLRWVIVNLCS